MKCVTIGQLALRLSSSDTYGSTINRTNRPLVILIDDKYYILLVRIKSELRFGNKAF